MSSQVEMKTSESYLLFVKQILALFRLSQHRHPTRDEREEIRNVADVLANNHPDADILGVEVTKQGVSVITSPSGTPGVQIAFSE
jgi:hypothetical protein